MYPRCTLALLPDFQSPIRLILLFSAWFRNWKIDLDKHPSSARLLDSGRMHVYAKDEGDSPLQATEPPIDEKSSL